MAKNSTEQNDGRPTTAFSQKLYELAETVPVYLGRGINAAFRTVLGGSRSERVIRDLQPLVEEVGEIGERLEEDLREDIGKRSISKFLEHFPDELNLVLTDELLPNSPEEVRERRCGDIEKELEKHLGDNEDITLIPGLQLDVAGTWKLHMGDELRKKLCEEMRRRLTGELVIALASDTQESIRKASGEKFPAGIADDTAKAIISRVEKALRVPVSELFFKPLTRQYKEKLAGGETLDDLLPEAFATARLASQLVVKTPGDNPGPMRHFDVQIIGGIVLHEGKIAEMVTGEGKTLVATLAAYLNSLTGKGVHVVTTNNFLARRDAAWMGPLYEFLGLTVAYLQHDIDTKEKQKHYQADITYGTKDEFGFDYLRDNMKTSAHLQAQRPPNYAIVDEVDNILIDEARTPLIISGMPEESTDKYHKANSVVQRLRPVIDYEVKEKEHSVTLSEEGEERVKEMLGVDSMYSGENIDWPHHMNQALVAKELYKRDRNYIVKNGEVIIVDDFTGRLQPGRRWSDGLHQAVEAKESLRIKQETQTLATITYQNFFRMYDKLAGMTGTALTEAAEFDKIYGLDVVPIPTNEPLRRVTFRDVIFATAKEKYEAIIDEIELVHATGRPVLVGTIAIEVSEHLSKMLERRGIKHEVLNAKYHEREAPIIARAGQVGAVTIATNMAGRGTDIVLAESVVKCRTCILRNGEHADPEDRPADICRNLRIDPDKPVTNVDNIPCGLHIIGTERHEARRIDNQLRGRSGRQGDPGSSRFFLSLEDDLMRVFMGEWVRGFMARAGFGEGQQIESQMVTRAIERAQKKVEQYNFEMRKNVLEYDEVMDGQRGVVYGMRQTVLDAMVPVEIREAIRNLVARFISDDLRNGPETALVTQRTFEPLQKKLDELGVHISEEEWLAADEKTFAKLVRQRVDPSKVRFGDDHIRGWIRTSLDPSMPEALHPSMWNLALIAEWANRHGIKLAEAELRKETCDAISDLVVAGAAEAAVGTSIEEYLRTWIDAALIMDMPLIANADTWDYSHVKQWADRLGIDIPVAEWDPISRKRDKQEELILQKMLKACEGEEVEEAARHYAGAALELYISSDHFGSDPKPQRIALWAKRRLGAEVDPAEMQELVAGLKQNVITRAFEAKKSRLDSHPDAAAGELAVIEVERYLADDFSSEDRNLVGIAAAFEERYGVKLPVFEMSKMSADELPSYLVGRVPPEIKHEIDATTVGEMITEMIDKSIDRAIDQFVSDRADPETLYVAVRDWLGPHGYKITPEEWQSLSLPELKQSVSMQARIAHEDETKEAVIDEFVPLTVETFLDSPLFAGEGGYSALASWAGGQFCFAISDTIEADLRKIGDKRKADLREKLVEEKVQGYRVVTDDPAEAAAEMVGEAVDLCLESSAGSEDFDETYVAGWAEKAFKLSLSRNELENRLELGETGVRNYIVETAAKTYARRPIDKIATDVADAVVGLCTSDNFVETWDYDLLQQWVKHSRAPMDFDIPAFEEETRAAVVGHFVDLAKAGYKDRAKEEVIPHVVGNALSIFIGCELSGEGQNYSALATKMNQKFNLGASPFRLSKMNRVEVEQWLHKHAGRLFEQRKRELGEYGFLRSVSALVLHNLDTRWKDHLYAMDHLKSGIGLRGYAGVDPKDAYKKEGYEMFMKMLTSAEESISDLALRVYFDDEESKRVARGRTAEERYVHEDAAAFDRGREQAAAAAGRDEAKPQPIRAQKAPGRNDPCPCGKKKSDGTPVKYKNCCMKRKPPA